MSGSILKVKSTRTKDIFSSMAYSNQTHDTNLAKVWLRENNYICLSGDNKTASGTATVINDLYGENIGVTIYTPTNDEIITIRKNAVNQLWINTEVSGLRNIINKFIAEIEINTELICQVELLMRGILPKDTKKHGVKLFLEYLIFCSNWPVEVDKCRYRKDVIVSDDNSLITLGYVLALTLASGATVLFQTGPRIGVLASLIKKLAIKAGVPEDVILIAPGVINPTIEFEVMSTVYIFDNLFSNKFSKLQMNPLNKIIAIKNLKTSAIVFNNADLDSACKTLINAVWEYQGFLPWSVDTVFVQEDIFQNFVDIFVDKLGRLHIGNDLEQSNDISCSASDAAVQKLQQMIETARFRSIEVHQFSQKKDAGFKPTVFVGGRAYLSNCIIENANDISAVTILPFRTANEAVSLANNSRQGLAVSIWSQNVDLINEIAHKVEVGTVWINCHGIVKADVSFEPRKGSGVGYFGGPEACIIKLEFLSLSSDVNTLVAGAKKAQQTWSKLPALSRIQKLSNWASQVGNESELNIKLWTASIYDSFKEFSRLGFSTVYDGKYSLSTYHEPIGIIACRAYDENAGFIKVITGALFLGNAVLIVTSDQNLEKYSVLTKSLPVFIVSDFNLQDVVDHRDVNVIIGLSPRVKSLFKKTYSLQDDWGFVRRSVTQIKNVWTTVGDSFC